ncbi:P-loop containing nucleoside triphosphate hydrolase protein [Sporodiniella umbellata]|nr:P-loop containing nucleoside triphosphate hydrolase protein [Sporodiniella umbellata]
MTSTAVRVGLRIRPLTAKEINNNCTECLLCIPSAPQISIGDKSFTYDYLFHNKTEQAQVYQQAASPLLHKFVDGFNATILAYGQTGSGKTYSMGTTLNADDSENDGIVPRCIIELFDVLKLKETQDSEFKYEVKASFLELYNEEFIDLLDSATNKRRSTANEVSIREDIAGQIYWSGVREEICSSPADVLAFLTQGSLCRTTGSTEMNSVSSRSHAIFSIVLKQQRLHEGKPKSLISKFHFVDLAGSERLKRTHAEGDRAREGIAINSGLLALGNVISALGDETRKMTHIPYRDSKLTRLLQDSLGGNSQTLMLACVSPADTNFQETLSTLKYANRARNIKNKVSVNQECTGNEVSQLRALVAKLRLEASQQGDAALKEQIRTLSARVAQLTRERDSLWVERALNGPEEIQTHPVIEQYQMTIQALRKELQESKTTKKTARRVPRRPVVTKSTSASLRKKYKKTAAAKSEEGEDEEDEGFVNDFQEQDLMRHEEVKESIAKVRADIRKSMEVLELAKPLDDLALEGDEENELQRMGSPHLDEFIHDIEELTRHSLSEFSNQTRFTAHLSRMLQQIHSDIKTKEELVSHLEKSETEYAFMRKKFDEKINLLELQIAEVQKNGTAGRQKPVDSDAKIKQMTAKIQDLTRKYTTATTNVQSARNQNESALRSLKNSIQRLEAEKKRLAQRMRLEAEKVREKMLKQERKIQQLQKQQAQSNQAKKRLEREHEEQKTALKKRSEECIVSTGQLKQMIHFMKKAVREGGILDEKMLVKLSPIMGGHFAVIARGGGHGFPKKKKKNPTPLGIRVSRKKQLLDKALAQYVQGRQAIVEMEHLLIRRERLVKEKVELEEEKEHVYATEKAHEESTGQPMDTMALELMEERIDLVSSEIAYLTSRVNSIQTEAAKESLQAECQLDLFLLQKPTKHVTFVDEIVSETNDEQQWMDVDTFEDQFTVPVNAAPEIAHEITCRLIRSFEADECQNIIEGLVDDIMELKMTDYRKQATVNDMEQVIADLKRTLSQNKEQEMLDLIKKNTADHPTCSERFISLPNSPVASPFNTIQPIPNTARRESDTPSPDRFFNMFQGRMSWQPQSKEIEEYMSDHNSSTSSIRSSHLRRSLPQSPDGLAPEELPQENLYHYQRPSPIQRLLRKPSHEKSSSVFDRLAQTPTRSSRAKINFRHSSGSVEDLKSKWEVEENRPSSATNNRFI